MKKFTFRRSVVLLIAIALLIAGFKLHNTSTTTTGNNTTAPSTAPSTAPVTTPSLVFNPRGTYNMPGFGEKFVIHHFNEVDVVVYEMFFYDDSSLFLLGENAGKNGDSYADISDDDMLIGISEKYWLFRTSTGERLARSLEEYTSPDGKRLYHVDVPWEELSQSEQDAFIYTVDTELIFNPFLVDSDN